MSPASGIARSQAGVTLIEVLVAVVVLSVGVLGLAGLQVFGLQQGQAGYERSQATLLAYEIADRMRAERLQAAAGAFALSAGASGLTAPAKDCTASVCGAAELAAWDLYDWDRRVRSLLPGGRARIACIDSCGLGRRQTITVFWDEQRRGADGTGCSQAAGDLACFSVSMAP
ncbi:MAG: hypothetical protein NVS9B10_03030 [Nevskia sp.]